MADSLSFPIPISHIQGRYLLFDINAITYLRKHHRICGVFIGTLPQNPSQNVFMGLPMEIMPEEAQVLLDDAVCYIVDDARAHDVALAKANRRRQGVYVRENEAKAMEISEEKGREKEFERKRALKKVGVGKGRKKGVESMGSSTETVTATVSTSIVEGTERYGVEGEGVPESESINLAEAESDSLFEAPLHQINNSKTSSTNQPQQPQSQSLHLTPSTSTTLLAPQSQPQTHQHPTHTIPLHSPSYTLFSHLHHHPNKYFSTPGLRFGCTFCVYPGDPLRYHSHFLAVGYDWDEEVDLMDFVGGGRLGTGVKKGWLVGGKEAGRDGGDGGKVRTWSVEWAGM